MNNRKKIAMVLIVIVIILVGIIGVYLYRDLTGADLDPMSRNVKKIEKQYEDVKGWIKIDGTSIDYPVFQSKDNERYLRKNRDNKETKWGEVFLDYRCNLTHMFDKSNIIIYGHNTEEDTNFTPLLKYQTEDFYKKNKIIKFATKDAVYKFEIFAVLETDTNYFYIDTKFDSQTEYDDFVKELKSKSIYDTGVELKTNDTILTLSTCDYTIKNGRFVVIGKLVK